MYRLSMKQNHSQGQGDQSSKHGSFLLSLMRSVHRHFLGIPCVPVTMPSAGQATVKEISKALPFRVVIMQVRVTMM